MVDYIGETQGNVRLPGVMMLGYVAAHSESLAMAVIVSKVNTHVECMTVILCNAVSHCVALDRYV